MNEIRLGQKVEINVDAFHDQNLSGTIESYGGATGSRFALIPPDNATGNFIKIAQRFPVRIKPQYPTGAAKWILVLTCVAYAVMELVYTTLVNVSLREISGSIDGGCRLLMI